MAQGTDAHRLFDAELPSMNLKKIQDYVDTRPASIRPLRWEPAWDIARAIGGYKRELKTYEQFITDFEVKEDMTQVWDALNPVSVKNKRG